MKKKLSNTDKILKTVKCFTDMKVNGRTFTRENLSDLRRGWARVLQWLSKQRQQDPLFDRQCELISRDVICKKMKTKTNKAKK